MTFEQKKARAIALMDSKKMWRSNYAPPLLRILWRLGIRLPPLPFMPFLAGRGADGGLMGHFLGMCNVVPRFYVSTSKSIIKALINMHSFEIQLSPIG
ncbi:DUF6404 family protein (plasmid) [Escherichia coli]